MTLKEKFNRLKQEYSNRETTKERKTALIQLMQENLKKRWGKDDDVIMCLDGKEYSISSDDIDHLYAIDGCLKAKDISDKKDEIAETSRTNADRLNLYGPANPYQES